MQGFKKKRTIFRELDSDSDSDAETEENHKQPKKIKYSNILQEEDFISDDDDSLFHFP
jgi:hypothetical protein